MSDLGEFLDREAQQGQLHSKGVFTVDLARAKFKLFRSQLPHPAMFLLQLVQAAVRSGCSEIRFLESSGGLFEGPPGLEMFCAAGDDSAFPLEKLRAHLLGDPLRMEDSALRDLVAGLGGALTLGDGVGIGYRGSTNWTLLEHSRLKSKTKGKGYVFLFDPFFKERCEHRIVHERCAYSPVPIYWNNRLVATTAPAWGSENRLLERLSRGEGMTVCMQSLPRVRNPGQRPAVLPETQLYCRQVLDDEGARIAGSKTVGALIYCQAALSVPYDLSGPSMLLLVRHGVTLVPVKVCDDFGCKVIASGNSLEVDLTGFQARENFELVRVIRDARYGLSRAGSAALDELPFAREVPGEGGLDSGMQVGCWLLGFALLFVSPVIGFGLLANLLQTRGKEKPASEGVQEAKMILYLRERLAALAALPSAIPPSN